MGLLRSRPGIRFLSIMILFTLCATGGCKQGPWTLWDAYSAKYIDPQGRVIDPQGDARTTSEGQSYAMFFALVANDRATFDRVLGWTQANLAGNDLQNHLPSWLWGKKQDGQWGTIDPSSASDSDLWIAYTLIEAGRLWKAPAYSSMGRGMLAQISRREVVFLPGFGTMLLPGAFGFQHDQIWTMNPSYLPPFILQRLAVVDPSGPWGQIALGIPRMLQMSSRRGFAMDWVNYVPGDGFYPAAKGPEKDAAPAMGSYDAIRVYLWAGMMDPNSKLRAEVLNAIPGMGLYLADHDAPPEKVSDQGVPMEQDGPVGFSAAVIPYLRAVPDFLKLSAKQTIRLSGMRDASTGLYGKDLAYYDQNLALFGTGFTDGRFRFGSDGELKVEWKG